MSVKAILKYKAPLMLSGLPVVLAYSIIMFAGIGFDLGVEGDDVFYLSEFLRQWQIDRDLSIASTIALRQTLVNTYIFLYEALGQSQLALHTFFAALWAASGVLCYIALSRSFSPAAATTATVFFLVYSGKYEVLGWASAGLHILVVCLLLLVIIVLQSKTARFSTKLIIASALYWISLLYYEILIPLAPLPLVWWLLIRRRTFFSWTEAGFSTLPIVVTAVHLFILSTAAKPIWERSGETNIYSLLQSIPGTLIRAFPFHVGSYPHDVKKFRAS